MNCVPLGNGKSIPLLACKTCDTEFVDHSNEEEQALNTIKKDRDKQERDDP